MARRLCRLPRLLLLAAAPKPQPQHRLPIPAVNPSPGALFPSFSSPTTPWPSFPTFHRLFCTSSSAGDSIMVVVGSADDFSTIHSKVQDEKLPAVFYYTTIWCGPCRVMAPVIEKLSKRYPKVPVYKVDINMVSELDNDAGSDSMGVNGLSVPRFGPSLVELMTYSC